MQGPDVPANLVAADMDASGGSIYMFGGMSSAYLNVLQIYRPSSSSWFLVPSGSVTPSPRNGHSVTALGGNIYVFGGWDATRYYNDIWAVDTNNFMFSNSSVVWRQISPRTAPPVRNSHTLVAFGGWLVLFGGFSHNISYHGAYVYCNDPQEQCVYYNDIWVWIPPTTPNDVINDWVKVTPNTQSDALPTPRFGHSAVMIGERMLIYGGQSATVSKLNDLWSYTFTTNTWTALAPAVGPGGRAFHVAGVIGVSMYLFGGNAADNAIWQYTPATVTSYTCQQPVVTCTPIVQSQDISLTGLNVGVSLSVVLTIIVIIGIAMLMKRFNDLIGKDGSYSAMSSEQMTAASERLTVQPIE